MYKLEVSTYLYLPEYILLMEPVFSKGLSPRIFKGILGIGMNDDGNFL